MEIFTLFDDVKYFKIEFMKNIDIEDIDKLHNIVENAFDMEQKVEVRKVALANNEIIIDCKHSLVHAEIKVKTKNQRGLLAYIMDCFETLEINVVTAKIYSTKHKVRDSFLIEKQNDICNNVEKIYKLLTKNSN